MGRVKYAFHNQKISPGGLKGDFCRYPHNSYKMMFRYTGSSSASIEVNGKTPIDFGGTRNALIACYYLQGEKFALYQAI